MSHLPDTSKQLFDTPAMQRISSAKGNVMQSMLMFWQLCEQPGLDYQTSKHKQHRVEST